MLSGGVRRRPAGRWLLDSATRSPEHQLLPRCVHPAPRTEPAGTGLHAGHCLTCYSDASSQTLLEVPPILRSRPRRDRLLHPVHVRTGTLLPHYHICRCRSRRRTVAPITSFCWIHTSHAMFLSKLLGPSLRTVFCKKFLAGLLATSTARACLNLGGSVAPPSAILRRSSN